MNATRTSRPATKSSAPKKPGPARRPAAKKAAPKPVEVPEVAPSAEKPRKAKLVRDSFTIPKTEYAAIDALKLRAAQAGHPAKKSELIRAGLMALSAMPAPAFAAAMRAVPPLKTGRPAKG